MKDANSASVSISLEVRGKSLPLQCVEMRRGDAPTVYETSSPYTILLTFTCCLIPHRLSVTMASYFDHLTPVLRNASEVFGSRRHHHACLLTSSLRANRATTTKALIA
jgi:hypothetical protein